jgi:hypothetical protein
MSAVQASRPSADLLLVLAVVVLVCAAVGIVLGARIYDLIA